MPGSNVVAITHLFFDFEVINLAKANECCSTPPMCGKKYSEQIKIFMLNSKFYIKLFLSLFLLIIIYKLYNVDFNAVVHETKKFNLNIFNILVLVSLVIFGILLTSIRYLYITKLFKIKIRFLDLVIINIAQFSLNNLSISGVGEAYKYLKLKKKKNRLKLFFSILIERYLTIVILSQVLCFFALKIYLDNILLIIVILFTLLLFFLNLEKFMPNIFKKFPYVDYYNFLYVELIKLFSEKKKNQFFLLIITILIQLISIFFYFYFFNFIANYQISILILILIIPIINFFNALPISIGGLGIRDTSFLLLLYYISANDLILIKSLSSTTLIGIFLIMISIIFLGILKINKRL